MSTVRDYQLSAAPAGRPLSPTRPDCLPLRVAKLRPCEAVFRVGDKKEFVFRVERGEIELKWPSLTGPMSDTETIGPNTVFGLGFLRHYAVDALALTPAEISCWSQSALRILETLDPNVRQRQHRETEREFDLRRRMLVGSTPVEPYRRLAGFLCLAARINAIDGRDPLLIDETVDCASVGAFLKMDLETLGAALVSLRKLDLIEYSDPRGIRIRNLDALEALMHPMAATADLKGASETITISDKVALVG